MVGHLTVTQVRRGTLLIFIAMAAGVTCVGSILLVYTFSLHCMIVVRTDFPVVRDAPPDTSYKQQQHLHDNSLAPAGGAQRRYTPLKKHGYTRMRENSSADDVSDMLRQFGVDGFEGGYHTRMVRTSKGGTKKLPKAIIIGVKKGGTRALLAFLCIHPDIRAPGPEPHFFDRNYEKGLEWYREKMPATIAGQITVEKTPCYFVTRSVPRRVRDMSRDVRLLVVVRDPVTRALSDYTQTTLKRTRAARAAHDPAAAQRWPSFEQMAFVNSSGTPGLGLVNTSWAAIRIGLYARHLERWLRYFPRSSMHFVSGERLVSDPASELARVTDFLGLKRVISDKHFYFNTTKGFPCLMKREGSSSPHCLGATKGRQHPHVSELVLRRLRDFYRPFNQKFYQMTGQDFGWS